LEKLPSLLQIIKKYELNTKKSLGQHFLTDTNLLDKIVQSAGGLSDYTVLEIGPGPGGLTRSILRKKPKKLIIIEKDSRCIPALEQLNKIYDTPLEIVEKDALNIRLSDISGGSKIKIIANLPYNISTELLINWLEESKYIENMTLMFQKEVAARISAKPNSKSYGRISVLTQWLCNTKLMFDVSPKAFTPPPKIFSSVILITPKEPEFYAKKELLEKICKVSFGQRRKMLRSSLKQLNCDTGKLLELSGISPEARPENLTVKEFCSLAANYEDLL
jgi:16S rRNA (adenine1518-N6/adenine1519-N6)-dimethyltransferase